MMPESIESLCKTECIDAVLYFLGQNRHIWFAINRSVNVNAELIRQLFHTMDIIYEKLIDYLSFVGLCL